MTAKQPFSIVGRIHTMVIGVSAAAVMLCIACIFVVLQPLTDDVALHMQSQMRMVEIAMRSVPADQRQKLADALHSDLVSVRKAAPASDRPFQAQDFQAPEFPTQEKGEPLIPPLLHVIEAAEQRRVDSRVVNLPDGTVRVSMDMSPIDGETWWITLSSVQPSLAWTLLPILISIGLATAASLFFGVRLVTRPMSKLAEDMMAGRDQLRRIEEPQPVSIELQDVIRSFNSLVGAVELSERSRHALLAGVSHDLRTPLARLRLRADIECPAEVADKMEGDFLAMSRIIDQFLAYAQGQNGVAAGKACPLAELVQTIVEQRRADGVDIVLRDAGDVRRVVPDLALQRVLSNLIDNAQEHGSGTIEVELRSEGPAASLMVFDQGRGIDPASFDHALQPFVRLTSDDGAGGHCGLGLAIVAQVAEQLGGRVVLSPYDGKRSGLGVQLPD